MELFCKLLFTLNFIHFTLSAPQQPEINDQFHANATEIETFNETINFINQTSTTEQNELKVDEKDKEDDNRKYLGTDESIANIDIKPNFIAIVYDIVTKPIIQFISSPKVTFVLRNVGTCLVNGAMEIIAYYFPAPFIPLIASAAGMVIPFEPVVMLKEKMPVTSYRRAFRKAMSSFMNTFDGYKADNYDEDPYMTRRFNRRFMNEVSGEKETKT